MVKKLNDKEIEKIKQMKIRSGNTYYYEIDEKDHAKLKTLKKFAWIRNELYEIQEMVNMKYDEDNHLQKSTRFKAIVISYGRLFTQSQARKYSINESEIEKYLSAENMKIHKYLMDLRHFFVAHASSEEYEEVNLIIKYIGKEVTIATQRLSKINFKYDDKDLLAFIKSHQKYFNEKHDKFQSQIIRDLGKKGDLFYYFIHSKDFINYSYKLTENKQESNK